MSVRARGLRGGAATAAVVGVALGLYVVQGPDIGTVTAGVAGGITGLVSLIYVRTGVNRARLSRELRADGDRAMANVGREAAVTEVHATLLPEESTYGGAMLRRYDEYQAGFRELTELGNQARAIPEQDYDSAEALETMRRYAAKASSLDHLDDVIADTAAFLNLDHTWREVWNRQVDPVRADLQEVEPLLRTELDKAHRGVPEVAKLRTFASQALVDLDQLRADLEEKNVTPDQALDQLRAVRDGLTAQLDALAGSVANAVGEDDSERESMREVMAYEREHRWEPTILCVSSPSWRWYPVSVFSTGYREGLLAVESSRTTS